MATILLPLPDRDFDVTEVAVPWQLLTEAGHRVVFATEAGATPACDPRLITGVVFGKLGARPEAIGFYRTMAQDPAFLQPVRWADVDPAAYDAVLLAGGHAPGMKQYLDSAAVQAIALAFVRAHKPIAAICHGVLVLARTIDPATGRSVVHGKKLTCLPKYMERAAYLSTFWKLGRYYRTYDAYVEDEVVAALASRGDFVRGPRTLSARGTREDDGPAMIVEDGALVTARWPGDAYLFAKTLLARLPATTSTAATRSPP